eukprot:1145180-Pelagomonas_calceolata.AAC.2
MPLAGLHTFRPPWIAYIMHSFQQKIRSADPVDLSQLVVDIKSCHLTNWRQFSSYHPRGLNSKKSTYHRWCALPTKNVHVTDSPYICPDTCTWIYLSTSYVAWPVSVSVTIL